MKHSKETKIKMSNAKKGDRNPRWNEGISEYPNHSELKKIRIEVLKKSNGKCEICGDHAQVVHHIDFSKDNHNIPNLIALCKKCHIAVHYGDKESNKKTSKYIRKYGMTLSQISQKIGASKATIIHWVKDPQKQKWLEEQLKDNEN